MSTRPLVHGLNLAILDALRLQEHSVTAITINLEATSLPTIDVKMVMDHDMENGLIEALKTYDIELIEREQYPGDVDRHPRKPGEAGPIMVISRSRDEYYQVCDRFGLVPGREARFIPRVEYLMGVGNCTIAFAGRFHERRDFLDLFEEAQFLRKFGDCRVVFQDAETTDFQDFPAFPAPPETTPA